ncbi:hypothetical protein KUTeg_011524, partial [Tegillarca granosa]
MGLVKKQAKICKQNLDLMGTVSHAAFITVDSTREQAYLHSISSAALVHSIARACSIGVTTKCSCGALPNHPPNNDFKWGGCGDDVKFGIYFSEVFTDAALSKKGKVKNSKKAQMNRHNNAVGRKILSASLSVACKCHGVSGSCSVKTCWKSLPDFANIATTLKNKYASAVEVKRRKRKGKKIFVPINPKFQTVTKDSLYIIQNPRIIVKRMPRQVPLVHVEDFVTSPVLVGEVVILCVVGVALKASPWRLLNVVNVNTTGVA